MNGSTFAILVAVAVQLALGAVVFLANRSRKSNQCFFFLSFIASAWLASWLRMAVRMKSVRFE